MNSQSERAKLADRINRLEFREYARVGWLKVATWQNLCRELYGGDEKFVKSMVPSTASPTDLAELARLFLQRWLLCHHPESICVFDLEVEFFQPVTYDDVLVITENIVQTSMNSPDAAIGGCLDWETPETPGETADVSYRQLRGWFLDLFDQNSLFFLHHDAGPIQPRVDYPHLLAIADDMIGLFWQE